MSQPTREPVPGLFTLVLHTHLPWLAHHGRWPVGEEWLYQSWAAAYLPLLRVLRTQEPRSISIACTHGLFADGALEKLAAAEDVSEIVCTNSVPTAVRHPKLTVLSVAPALAEAIRRTHDGESVSVLFQQ